MKKILILMASPFALLCACTSAKITSSWKSPAISKPPAFKKVLVLSLMNQKDRSLQEYVEKKLSGGLSDLGYDAYAALSLYGPKLFEGMKEQAVLDSLNHFGFDAVMTVVLLNKHRERRYIQQKQHPASAFWDYYDLRYGRIDDPGYYVTDTKYFWEANLYDMSTHQLLYSAQTRTFEYNTKKAMAADYSHLLINDMTKKKIIQSLQPWNSD